MFRTGWTAALGHQVKKRSKMLRGTDEEKMQAREIDRNIKRQMRANVRKIHAKTTIETGTRSPRENIRSLKFLLWKTHQTPSIDADDFTHHFAPQQRQSPTVDVIQFELPSNFSSYMTQSLQTDMNGKSASPNVVHNEMLQIQPKIVAQALTAILRKVGELGYIPSQLTEGTLVPVFKKGDREVIGNYRPIMILSHIRKAITGAIGLWLRDCYTPHRDQ